MEPVKSNKESGFALLPVLIMSIVIGLFLLIYEMDMQKSSISISQGQLHAAQTAALSMGASQAAQTLNNYTNWPEVLPSAQYFSPLPVVGGVPQSPAIPSPSYWQSCASATNNPCASFTETENGVPLTVQYIIYQSMGLPQEISGYQTSGSPALQPPRFYTTFVHVSNASDSSQVTEVVLLRKVLG